MASKSTGVELDGHAVWSDDEWENNVLIGEVVFRSPVKMPEVVRGSTIPKFSWEDGYMVFGPLDELTPTMFKELAREADERADAASEERYLEATRQYEEARHRFEELVDELRGNERR